MKTVDIDTKPLSQLVCTVSGTSQPFGVTIV